MKRAAARRSDVVLLAADLDGTLVPAAWSDERAREMKSFRRVIAQRDLRLAYITGRHLQRAVAVMEACDLPRPDFVACEAGTALYVPEDGGYRPVMEYRERMAVALRVPADAVRGALAPVPDLALQDADEQGDFKASFMAPWPLDGTLVSEVYRRLADVGARASVITSRARDGSALVDVLPAATGTDRAVRYMATRLGVHAQRVVFAGDSGNDRDALLSGAWGIVVANAHPDFVEEVRREARRWGLEERIHFASLPYVAGVVEGLRHFGVLS
jgi:sucrose-6-phosphatase